MAQLDPTNPFQQEVVGLDRQRQLAQMLIKQGMEQPQGQMVSGRFVAPAWTERLANLLNIYSGQRGLEEADKKQLELAQKLRQDQQRLGTEFFENISPVQTELAGPTPTGAPLTTVNQPNYQRAIQIASDPNAPAYAKAYVNELFKPRVMKEGETLQTPSLTGGQLSFNQMGGGGTVLPSDIKSAALRVGLNPTQSNTWGQKEWDAINNRIVSDKEAGRTNLVVNTGKAYTGAFGEGIAKEDLSKYSIAEKAPSIYQNALTTEDLIKKGAITGLGAEFKLNLARTLNVAGANNADIIRNTEQLVANRGQIVLDSIKASGLGAGQGFTNTDRQFLEKVKGGTIELNAKTLLDLARIEKNVAKAAVDAWNKRLPNIPKEAIQGTGVGPVQLQQNQWRIKGQ